MFISKKKWQEVIGRLDCQQDNLQRLKERLWRIEHPAKYKVGNHKKFIITQIDFRTHLVGYHWQYHITMPNGSTGVRYEHEITEMLKKK